MEMSVEQQIHKLPVRARVALALASAERVLPVLTGTPEVYRVAQAALSKGWTWEMSGEVPALEIYNHANRLNGFLLEGVIIAGTPQESALYSAIMALYYTTWKAAGLQSQNGADEQLNLLSKKIADVSEEYVVNCLVYATQAVADEDEEISWQDEILRRLLADFSSAAKGSLGESIPPGYFQVDEPPPAG